MKEYVITNQIGRNMYYTYMGVGLGHRGGPSLAAGPRGGLQRGVYLVKTSFIGGAGILKASEGGLYISPCKTPILFIVLPQL